MRAGLVGFLLFVIGHPSLGAEPGCEDQNAFCANWAAAGECEKNADFMRFTCPQSCIKDQQAFCADWAANGECDKNHDFMLANCARSCNPCKPGAAAPVVAAAVETPKPEEEPDLPGCKDEDPACPDWAAAGECGKNAEFMRATCPKACSKDQNDFCIDWAANGECESNRDFMLATCPWSCADDMYDFCPEWAAKGECLSNEEFMNVACVQSCTPNPCLKTIDPKLTMLGEERVHVTFAGYGEVVLGFFPKAAPRTVWHVLRLFRLGCYKTDHIFRLDPGFFAQIQTVSEGTRQRPLTPDCRRQAPRKVPAEFTGIKHVRGTLSMARFSDPNSGTSSFNIMLGPAPQKDGLFTVFGRVVEGMHVLEKLEKAETTLEDKFLVPKQRIEISDIKVSSVKVNHPSRK